MRGPPRLALWSGISALEGTGVARWLIVLGALLILAGLLWPWLVKLGLGRLPGDIVIERERVRIYRRSRPRSWSASCSPWFSP